MPRFRVAIMRNGDKEWLPWMRGMTDEGGSSDTFAGVPGCGIVDVEFEGGSLGPHGWFTKNMSDGKLIGITVFYDTPDPGRTGYYEALYRCHRMGPNPAWGKYDHGGGNGSGMTADSSHHGPSSSVVWRLRGFGRAVAGRNI
jgi:hypothetical protein